MRIIAGEFRHRQLLTPRDAETTRPIPDRVKESLFSLLRGHCEGATAFDAFAGTGAIGLEAVSRGAVKCVMVEKDRTIGEILRKNVEMLGAGDRCEVVIGDALGAGALARCPRPLTLAFFDPPYPIVREALGFKRVMGQLQSVIALLTDDGFAALRTPWPLRHAEGVVEPVLADEAPERRWRKKGKGRRHDWGEEQESPRGSPRPGRVEELRPDDEIVEEALDADETAEAPGDADDAPKPQWKDADLRLPNAVGPETHVYGTMAVHLYMRKKNAALKDPSA